jgi:Kef-type K+ transport system membrane component KefB
VKSFLQLIDRNLTEVMAAIGLTFAAFWVWICVRIFNRREPWAIELAVTIIVVLMVAYVALRIALR